MARVADEKVSWVGLQRYVDVGFDADAADWQGLEEGHAPSIVVMAVARNWCHRG